MKPLSPVIQSLDFSDKGHQQLGTSFRAQAVELSQYGSHVSEALSLSVSQAVQLTKGILSTASSRAQYRAEAHELITWAKDAGEAERKIITKGLIEAGGLLSEVFLIQQISGMAPSQAGSFIQIFLAEGGSIGAIAEWFRLAGRVLQKRRVRTRSLAAAADIVEDAANWVLDTIEEGADAILGQINALLDAIYEAGMSVVKLMQVAVSWSVEKLRELISALLDAGLELSEIMEDVMTWTYAAATRFVQAAMAVGVRIAALLEPVVERSYWAFRRIVNGILQASGPITEILDWVREKADAVGGLLWRRVVLAIRYVHGTLSSVLDWMVDKGTEVIQAVLVAWESIEEPLMDVYTWASGVGLSVWEHIGEATVRIGNSVYYVLGFLRENFEEGISAFVSGILEAGFAVAAVVGWMVQESLGIIAETTRTLLDAGISLGQLIADAAQNPGNALRNLIQAVLTIRDAIAEILQAVIDTAEELLEAVVFTLRELGRSIREILEAVLTIKEVAIDLVVTGLLNTLASYRPITTQEIEDARTVFGNSLDYSRIYLSIESLTNDVIFGIQDFINQNPDSRAFVTNTLINFDADEGLNRHTLIHELTHVWQYTFEGPFYFAEAIHAQVPVIGSGGYNYGYRVEDAADEEQLTIPLDYEGTMGRIISIGAVFGIDGEAALDAAAGDFDAFNPEQQGQILQQWFVRTQLPITDANGNSVTLDASSWQPYRDFVFGS